MPFKMPCNRPDQRAEQGEATQSVAEALAY